MTVELENLSQYELGGHISRLNDFDVFLGLEGLVVGRSILGWPKFLYD